MTQRVPYPFISGGIDDRSRREIERNFQYISDQLVGSATTGFDAMVDGTRTVDDTKNLIFVTVFNAVKYVVDTLNNFSPVIGLVGASSKASCTEVGNYAGTNSGVRVHLVGVGQIGGTFPDISHPTWNLQNFTENSKWTSLTVSNVYLTRSAGTQANWWANANMPVFASNCVFDANSSSSSTATTNMASIRANDCVFLDTGFNGGTVVAHGCLFYLARPTSCTWSSTFLCQACEIAYNNTATLSLTTTGYLVFEGGVSSASDWSGTGTNSANVLTITIANAVVVSFKTSAPTLGPLGSQNGAFLNITSTSVRELIVEGYYNEIVTPLVVTTRGSSHISAACYLRADVTGPANISLTVGSGGALTTYGVRLRGSGISGTVAVRMADTASAATALDYISASRSAILASIARDGALSTGAKPYNFDAGCANNILVLEAASLGVAGADAGASDLVITDAGVPSSPTGAAGGDLAGSTYPSPVVAANVITNAKLAQMAASTIKGNNTAGVANAIDLTVAQVKVLLAFIATGDAAGGSLAGTFPSPTFAGRFPSVAELDKDFTKHFMLGTL